MRSDLTYTDWKKEVSIWSKFTDLDKKKQGGALFLSLTDKARETVLAEVPEVAYEKDDIVDVILKSLDKLLLKDDSETAFQAFDSFIKFRRPKSMPIDKFLAEFNLKYTKIKGHNMALPDGVLAYAVLTCANLPDDQAQICRATCSELKYELMRKQIEKVTLEPPSKTVDETVTVQPVLYAHDDYDNESYWEAEHYDNCDQPPVEESENCEEYDVKTYYMSRPFRRPYTTRGGPSQRHPYGKQWAGHQGNPIDEMGYPLTCRFCKSTCHMLRECPHAPAHLKERPYSRGRGGYRGDRGGRGRGSSMSQPAGYSFWQEETQPENVLLAEPECDSTELLSETIGYAILDSGCNVTVCGQTWLNTFIESLSNENAKSIKHLQSSVKFRFGDGKIYDSVDCVQLPVYVGRKRVILTTHVVTCNIPLLLSRDSMKKAGCHLDFMNDRVTLFDEHISLRLSQSGHYCVPLFQYCNQSVNALRNHVQNVMFSTPSFSTDKDKCIRQVRKLHKQFAHPTPVKLKKLLYDAGVDDKLVMGVVDKVSNECDVCKRFKCPPLRPIVSFPLANDFNETVAVDMKVINGKLVLHMIDHVTRYSSACVLANKRKETIVQALMEYWVRIFGAPVFLLSDNGGEFVNDEIIEYAEKFNIELRTTAAESAWSNGLCEWHNASLANNVLKTMNDAECSLEMAVHWSIAAKNALSNVYGFSPNQLVFGRNTNLPSAFHNKLPAQNPTCRSRYIAQNLAALHKAREAFIQQETCEKLQRALTHQTRTYADVVYNNGDMVYYKRESAHEWHGPAKIIGRDNQRYLLKHGGTYHRVHPCKMQHVTDSDQNLCKVGTRCSATQTSEDVTDKTVPICDHVALPEDDEDDEMHAPAIESALLTPPSTPQQYQNLPVMNHHPDKEHYNRRPVQLTPKPLDDGKVQDSPTPPEDSPVSREIPPEPNFNTPPEATSPAKSTSRAESNNNPDPNFRTPPTQIPRALARLLDHNKPGKSEQVLHATSSTSPRFDQAKQQELQKWINMDTYVEVCDVGQPRISTRWVCTEKVKGRDIVLKARLVARGFEENTN